MGKVFIYGAIGNEIDAQAIIKEINAETTELDVHINSPGGSVYDGFAIFNALQRKRDILTTYIDGLAYSAASWLALAAPPERRYMSKASQFGIHQAATFVGGNKDNLQKQVDALAKIDQIQIEIYVKATDLSESVILDIMEADTPLNFKESEAFGFQEFEAEKIAALFNINEMSKLEDFLKHFKGEETIPEVEAEAKETVEAAHKDAETPVEALSANFTAKADFLEFKATTEPFMEAIIEYIKEQPKEDAIKAMIEEAAKAQLTALLDTIKTKGQVPTKEEVFPEAKAEPQTFEPLTLKKNTFELLNDKK